MRLRAPTSRPIVARAAAEGGFTLLEMIVSMGIMVVVTGSIFQMVGSSQSAFRAQPEIVDMQQRLRVAADMIYNDLLMAGSGPYQAPRVSALGNYFPAVRPARRGAQSPDAELAYADDRISIVYVPNTRAQTVLTVDMGSSSADLPIDAVQAGCPTGGSCGFAVGTRALIFDGNGVGLGYDVFTVTGSALGLLQHASPNPAFTRAYAMATARVTQVEDHVYYHDPATQQLMHYDGHQVDSPLVDNVVGLTFTYHADPDPQSAPKPAAGVANCVYDASSPPVPLLTDLGGTALKALTAGQLGDGPTCGVGTNQFDGDLLRVRKVRVTIRVQVAKADLRGSDTNQFKGGGGVSKSGQKFVPDYSMSFEVTPRNMNLIR